MDECHGSFEVGRALPLPAFTRTLHRGRSQPTTVEGARARRGMVTMSAFHPQHHIVQGTYRLWGGPGHGPKEELGARPLTRSL